MSCESSECSHSESFWVHGCKKHHIVRFIADGGFSLYPLDVEGYYAECVKVWTEHKEKNKHRFPLPSLGSYGCPLTAVNIQGQIMLWYLLGLLLIRQQVSLKKSYHHPESGGLPSWLFGMEPWASHICWQNLSRRKLQGSQLWTGRYTRSTLLPNSHHEFVNLVQ